MNSASGTKPCFFAIAQMIVALESPCMQLLAPSAIYWQTVRVFGLSTLHTAETIALRQPALIYSAGLSLLLCERRIDGWP